MDARGSDASTGGEDGGEIAGGPVDSAVDVHSRVVASPLGRGLVTSLVVVFGVWIVGPNLPAGPLRDDVDVLWEPAIELGLVQDWGVFSPNPRDQSLDVRARLEYDDGTVEFWDVPQFDPFVGAYRQYRWNKWQERVRLDSRRDLWEPTAAWIADERLRDGERPARITLIRRWIDHEPLGSPTPIDSGWNEFEFYTWERDP